jgi:N-acetylneuraminic acid mutarotase
MAGQALSAGTTGRKRVLFGLLDGDSWTWASVKAAFWFVVIVMMLGYLPDRAYYFTVFPTIDLGVNVVSPVNFCPPENRTLPCPAPVGATLPWDPSPTDLALPAPRTRGAVVQLGTRMLYVGGSDGTAATDGTFVADLYSGTFGPWQAGGRLPAPRAAAGVVALNGVIYVAGGYGADGAPTDTVFVASQDLATGALGEFAVNDALKLPEARAAASLLAAGDGLILIGGTNGTAYQPTVWKAVLDKGGKLGPWTPQAALPTGIGEASAALAGDHLFLYGGRDDRGPVGLVLRGNVGKDKENLGRIVSWDIGGAGTNLPVARTRGTGFTANGVLYLVGGSDEAGLHGEMYWTVPDPQGNLPGWQHLPVTDLPVGVEGASALVSGSVVFIVGGTESNGSLVGSARANLAPQAPFFQLGLLGVTVPALKIGGEIGQQLGYLNAAGVGTVNFVLLLLIGWAFAHKERTRAILRRIGGRARR